MNEYFSNRDGWWNKHIRNTGPVEHPTLYCKPHWQCTECEFNNEDMEIVRHHVFDNHKSMEPPPKKMWNIGDEGSDSKGG